MKNTTNRGSNEILHNHTINTLDAGPYGVDSQETVMSKPRICPIMARGWLSSGYAARARLVENTWAYDNLPKCIEEDCALWGHVLKRLEKCCRLGITNG